MMDVASVRDCIGTKRFVWIDDEFNNSAEKLGMMLIESIEVTKMCGFPEIDALMEGSEFDPTDVQHDVVAHLRGLGIEALNDIRRRFFDKRSEMGWSGTELQDDLIDAVCGTLGIEKADRYPFVEGIEAVKRLCDKAADSEIGYIIDLNDARSDDNRGLEIVQILADASSKGIAFILTHDTEISGEAAKEAELLEKLAGMRSSGLSIDVPVCVIAKDRLRRVEGADPRKVDQPLAIALKRAGLRRCMHEVLRHAESHVHKEFTAAAGSLLNISPEALDAFVVERSYAEGLSELHVVERALAAHMSMSLRRLFGTHPAVRQNADVMRRLRDVALDGAPPPTDDRLEAFRRAEIWEGDELINAGFVPVACGDVFECDMDELTGATKKRRYLVVGQPCDIALRSNGKREQEATFLVPMEERPADAGEGRDKPKTISFPFAIAGKVWVCKLRNTTMARLAVLDLASFRNDGMVRVDEGQTMPAGLLPGQQKIFQDRTRAAFDTLKNKPEAGSKKTPELKLVDPDLQLTLSRDGDYRRIHHGEFEPPANGRPARITWRLKRVGRVQMPYAAAMLEALSGSMSRRAFDLDFAKAKSSGKAGSDGTADGLTVRPSHVAPTTKEERPGVGSPTRS